MCSTVCKDFFHCGGVATFEKYNGVLFTTNVFAKRGSRTLLGSRTGFLPTKKTFHSSKWSKEGGVIGKEALSMLQRCCGTKKSKIFFSLHRVTVR